MHTGITVGQVVCCQEVQLGFSPEPQGSGKVENLIGKVENLGLITETQIVVVEGGHSPDHSSNVLLSPVSLNSVFLTPKIAPAYISVYPCRGTRDTAGKLVTLY